MSAAASHLDVLDRVVSKAVSLIDGLIVCDLEQRRRVAALYLFYKILYYYPNHALEAKLSRVHVPARLARPVVSVRLLQVFPGLTQCDLVDILLLRVRSIRILWMSTALLVKVLLFLRL